MSTGAGLDDWLNNFDRVLEQKYMFYATATSNGSSQSTSTSSGQSTINRMPSPFTTSEFVDQMKQLYWNKNCTPVSTLDAAVWDIYDRCLDATKTAIDDAGGIEYFLARRPEFLISNNQFILRPITKPNPIGFPAATKSPIPNEPQRFFNPTPTVSNRVVKGVVRMVHPNYGLAESSVHDTLIFFLPKSLALSQPLSAACAMPMVSELLSAGDPVEMLVVPQQEQEGIRWFAEKVRKIIAAQPPPAAAASLAPKKFDSMDKLESVDKLQEDEDDEWCVVGQKSGKPKVPALHLNGNSARHRDESISYGSASSLVSEPQLPVGLTGEAARSLLSANHLEPPGTKANKKNRKRRAKNKTNVDASTASESATTASNGHLSDEESDLIEETPEPLPISNGDSEPPVIKSVVDEQTDSQPLELSDNVPDTWEDTVLERSSETVMVAPAVAVSAIQSAKKKKKKQQSRAAAVVGGPMSAGESNSVEVMSDSADDQMLSVIETLQERVVVALDEVMDGKLVPSTYSDDANSQGSVRFTQAFHRLRQQDKGIQNQL